MILCIDVGNSTIHIGVFEANNLIAQVRYSSKQTMSSDQFGVFMKSSLIEHQIDWQNIKHIMICSVVPELDYSIGSACIKYFKITPSFLGPDSNTGLVVKHRNPAEVGADLIATAIGGVELYAGQHILIVDMGTATTVCAVTRHKEFLGGAIIAGMQTSIKALHDNTSKLSFVQIAKPPVRLGYNTKESMQIGLYYGHLGAIKEVVTYLSEHAFNGQEAVIIATGGFSELYKNHGLFDAIVPDLALKGLNKLYYLHQGITN